MQPVEHAVPRGRLLLVSPHLDDAALSCAALLERPEPIDLLTVFAGEPRPALRGVWDEVTGFASSTESIRARRAEERAAFTGSGHRLAALPLLELQYLSGPRPPEDAHVLGDALRRWVADGGGWVAVPAGAGAAPAPPPGRPRSWLRRLRALGPGRRRPRAPEEAELHPDHTFVRDVAIGTLGDRGDVTILAYEELPYSLSGRADRRVASAALLAGRRAAPMTLPIDRHAKAARIRAYASQVPHLSMAGCRVDEPTSLPAEERYWVLAPADSAQATLGSGGSAPAHAR